MYMNADSALALQLACDWHAHAGARHVAAHLLHNAMSAGSDGASAAAVRRRPPPLAALGASLGRATTLAEAVTLNGMKSGDSGSGSCIRQPNLSGGALLIKLPCI